MRVFLQSTIILTYLAQNLLGKCYDSFVYWGFCSIFFFFYFYFCLFNKLFKSKLKIKTILYNLSMAKFYFRINMREKFYQKTSLVRTWKLWQEEAALPIHRWRDIRHEPRLYLLCPGGEQGDRRGPDPADPDVLHRVLGGWQALCGSAAQGLAEKHNR